MQAYLAIWFAAGLLGLVAARVVVRYHGAREGRALVGLALAWGAFAVGSKLHFRLEHWPLGEALLVSPADLLGPGHHTPFGLVLGALALMAWARVARVPGTMLADAGAVGACVMLGIGRLGCFVAGCCTGLPCGWPGLPLCMRHPPQTEPFGLQLAAGLIPADSPWSLPVHPLPLYFAAAAVVTLAVCVVLLRRDGVAGRAGIAFCLAEPAFKLVLETFRASTPHGPAGLMLALPAATLMVTLVAIVVRRAHARSSRAEVATLVPVR